MPTLIFRTLPAPEQALEFNTALMNCITIFTSVNSLFRIIKSKSLLYATLCGRDTAWIPALYYVHKLFRQFHMLFGMETAVLDNIDRNMGIYKAN